MAMTVREAFEKGTDTFNAHDIDGFTGVLTDDVTYRAPGGIGGQGNKPAPSSSPTGSPPSPTHTST